MMSLILHLLKKIEPYILYLKLGYMPPTVSPIQRKESIFEKTLEKIDNVDFSDQYYVYSPELSNVKVAVFANNAREQVVLTNHLISALERDAPIAKSVVDSAVRVVYLRDFFVDNEGNYDNVFERSKDLKEASYKLVKLFIDKEDDIQKDTHTFHNRVVLGPIIQAIASHYESIEQYVSNRT